MRLTYTVFHIIILRLSGNQSHSRPHVFSAPPIISLGGPNIPFKITFTKSLHLSNHVLLDASSVSW